MYKWLIFVESNEIFSKYSSCEFKSILKFTTLFQYVLLQDVHIFSEKIAAVKLFIFKQSIFI